jgi:hypothetical protein
MPDCEATMTPAPPRRSRCEAYLARPGRSTTLMTPSSLSRNFLYMAGASSKLAGWVTTKLGSMCCRKAGTVSIPGVYVGWVIKFRLVLP